MTVRRPDEVVARELGVTRQDLVDHHLAVAEAMLPHLIDRPLLLLRRHGHDERSSYQKHTPAEWPAWIRRLHVHDGDRTVAHPVAEETATLVFLADQSTLTLYAWQSRGEHLDRPDRMVFDLDPPHGPVRDHFPSVCDGALSLGDRLGALGAKPHFLLTGSKGLHVVVPLTPDGPFEPVRAFAESLAEDMVAERPDVFTTSRTSQRRDGRILVDTSRNAFGQSMVAPYSLRDKPRLPVATPVEADELTDPRLTPRRYTITNVTRRLETIGDPWKDIDRHRVPLSRLDARHRAAHSEASF